MLTRPGTAGRSWRRRAVRWGLVAVLAAAPACADDDDTAADEDDRPEAAEELEAAEEAEAADASAAPDGAPAPEGVTTTARTCQGLADDPVFGGKATVVGEISGGDALGCVVEVPVASAVLEDLNLSTTDCSADDGISLPFTRTDDGWEFDRDQIDGVNTGTCSVDAG